MEIIDTGFEGLLLVKPKIYADNRGYFFESYNLHVLLAKGLQVNFVQDNQSESVYGVIRGLHYQIEPHAQTKLVRVLNGRIFDIAVDLRKGSPNFGKWYGVEISGTNKYQLFIPKGFAHGFSVLSKKALVLYKTDNYYEPRSERGILYNDAELKIDWRLDPHVTVVSDRDQNLPFFQDAEMNFIYRP